MPTIAILPDLTRAEARDVFEARFITPLRANPYEPFGPLWSAYELGPGSRPPRLAPDG